MTSSGQIASLRSQQNASQPRRRSRTTQRCGRLLGDRRLADARGGAPAAGAFRLACHSGIRTWRRKCPSSPRVYNRDQKSSHSPLTAPFPFFVTSLSPMKTPLQSIKLAPYCPLPLSRLLDSVGDDPSRSNTPFSLQFSTIHLSTLPLAALPKYSTP